eukprot:1396030-Pleurochrysis_carterae.AAC.1
MALTDGVRWCKRCVPHQLRLPEQLEAKVLEAQILRASSIERSDMVAATGAHRSSGQRLRSCPWARSRAASNRRAGCPGCSKAIGRGGAARSAKSSVVRRLRDR